jgi:hypothetical protein
VYVGSLAAGYEVAHDGRCITVFSAPNYCDQVGNQGAIVIFKDDLKPNFVTFAAVVRACPVHRLRPPASGIG